MRYKILLIIFLLGQVALAQQLQDSVQEPNDYSFKDKNYFATTRLGWCAGTTPAMNVTRSYQREENGKTITVSETSKYSVFWISIISIGYEPRINLKNFDDKASISLSVPIDLSLGLSVSSDDEINTGFFAASTGFFIDGNMGNHATFNNIDKNGFSAGLGLRITKAPLFGLGKALSSRDYKYDRLAFGPSLRFIFKTDKANGRNMGYYFETGIPRSFENLESPTNLYLRIHMCKFLNY